MISICPLSAKVMVEKWKGYLWLFSHDGKLRILNFNSKCAFWITSVYTWSKYLRIFELHIIHTSDRKYDSPFESVEKRHGCVWVACQSNMHVCCLRFLCMCSARYYRWKWLEGHTSSAPQNTILRSSHSYTDFVAWFARIVTGKHLCTVWFDLMRISNYVLRRDLAYTRSSLRILNFN